MTTINNTYEDELINTIFENVIDDKKVANLIYTSNKKKLINSTYYTT